MDTHFVNKLSELPSLLLKLRKHQAFKRNLKRNKLGHLPKKAIYLFSKNNVPQYVGRTNNLQQRLRQHCTGKTDTEASFAFKIAKQEFSVIGEMTRKQMMENSEFSQLFECAKSTVREMDIRYVEVTDQLTQTLFEIYCAVAFKTPFNSFENH